MSRKEGGLGEQLEVSKNQTSFWHTFPPYENNLKYIHIHTHTHTHVNMYVCTYISISIYVCVNGLLRNSSLGCVAFEVHLLLVLIEEMKEYLK